MGRKFPKTEGQLDAEKFAKRTSRDGWTPLNHFHLLGHCDIGRVVSELRSQPELWNQHSERTKSKVFADTSDIWVRFRNYAELTSPEKYGEPHFPVWYPAWHKLPALHSIVYGVNKMVNSVHLGGVLITMIPAGGRILPHHDRGSWHAEFHNIKVYVPLVTNDRCINRCEDEAVLMRAGEIWTFDNLKVHSVDNAGNTPRQTLIISMRCE